MSELPQPTLSLSAAQIAFYYENGYLSIPALTTPEEVAGHDAQKLPTTASSPCAPAATKATSSTSPAPTKKARKPPCRKFSIRHSMRPKMKHTLARAGQCPPYRQPVTRRRRCRHGRRPRHFQTRFQRRRNPLAPGRSLLGPVARLQLHQRLDAALRKPRPRTAACNSFPAATASKSCRTSQLATTRASTASN